MKAFVVTVVGIALSVAASLANIDWLTVLAALVAVVGAYAQYKDTLPFEVVFTESMWQTTGTEFQIVVSKSKHNKSNPTATVFLGQSPKFELISCDICSDADDGAVVVTARRPFSGKVVVK